MEGGEGADEEIQIAGIGDEVGEGDIVVDAQDVGFGEVFEGGGSFDLGEDAIALELGDEAAEGAIRDGIGLGVLDEEGIVNKKCAGIGVEAEEANEGSHDFGRQRRDGGSGLGEESGGV